MHEFDYVAVATVDEAVAALSNGKQARPLSGGTDLLSQMKDGRYQPELVVDVKRIPELTTLRFDPGEGLTIGAAVPCRVMNHSAEVKAHYPGLIGGVQIQGRASLGGNLCNASPAADGIPNLIAHHATAHIAGPNGRRTLAVEEFCTGPGRNALAPGEFLVALTLPMPPAHFGAAYLRFTPRNEMDIAVTGAGTSVVLSEDGRTIESARVALGAVAPTPILVEAISEALAGQPVSEETFERAAALASEAARPITDMRGTIAQRKHLAGVLTKRTLRIAVDRARGIHTVDSLGRLNGAHG